MAKSLRVGPEFTAEELAQFNADKKEPIFVRKPHTDTYPASAGDFGIRGFEEHKSAALLLTKTERHLGFGLVSLEWDRRRSTQLRFLRAFALRAARSLRALGGV